MSKEKPQPNADAHQAQNLTNQELLQKIYENTEKMRKYVLWKRIFSWAKVIVIAAVIVAGIVYIPPLIEKAIQPYKELLQTTQQGQQMLDNLDINELFQMYKQK